MTGTPIRWGCGRSRRPATLDVSNPAEMHAYRRLPASTHNSWCPQLAHQAAEVPDAARCLALVFEAVDAIRQ